MLQTANEPLITFRIQRNSISDQCPIAATKCHIWCRIYLCFRLMGGLQAKSMTSQRYRAVTRWRICYYGNVMTTTRWWLCVTMFYIFNSTVIDWTCLCFLYCRSYCLLNMFRAPLCPSSGAQEYYTVVAAYGIWCCASCKPDTQPTALHQTDTLKIKAPNTTGSNHLYNILELLIMGIMVPETCWASNKICNKENICCI